MPRKFRTPNPGRFKRKAKFEVRLFIKYMACTAALIVGSWWAGLGVGHIISWVIRL